MKEQFIRAVRKSGTSLSINLPTEMIRLLNIEKGDLLRIEIEKIKVTK